VIWPLALLLTLASGPKPLMRDFIGLNTHTIQFRPDLYWPVAHIVRDYHPVIWDLGNDPTNATRFPFTPEGISWNQVYGPWKQAGYHIDVTAMYDTISADKWTDVPHQAFAYGESFARFFGPSGDSKFVDSLEIGNEPSKSTAAQYRQMFESMARGVRQGDPKMLIATCAVALGDKDPYSKDVNCLNGLQSLYDILNVHTYAFKSYWPTWERSNPEDPATTFLKIPQQIIDWRNANAPGKQVWVTEFGWDSSTKPAAKTGDMSKWVGSTDTEQAQFIVRAYLLFAAMDLQRAYLFWFNDSDEPSLHAASGLTRNFVPKPSFYAVTHLLQTLGDYRFDRVLVKDQDGAYAYKFKHRSRSGDSIVAVWMGTRHGEKTEVTLPALGGKVVRAERMPLTPKLAETVPFRTTADGKVTVEVDGSPVYLWIKN